VDTITGTAGSDTFTAIDEANLAAGDTLQVADAINGGAGTDTLNITATQEGAIAALNLTSVENIVIRTTNDEDGTGESFAATGYTGVERITLDRITDDFSLTGVSLSTVANVTNNAGTTVDVTVDYLDTAETGTADAATIEVNAFDASSDLTVAIGVETLTINSVGTTASTIAELDIDGVKTLNLVGTSSALTITEADAGADNETTSIVVTGANKVTVTNALSTAVTSINASAATGGSTFALTGLTAPTFTGGSGVDTITAVTTDSTVTTGAGNDVVTLGTIVVGATGSIAGGDGTDTLTIGDATTTLFTTATKARISGFETLRVATIAGTNDGQVVDFDTMTGFTGLEIGDNDDLTVNDIATSVLAAGVNVLAANTGSLVLNATDATVPGTADTLRLVLDHATADTAVTIVDLQAAGVETLTVVSSGAGTNTNSIELGTENSTLANINISGASKFTLTTQGAADVGGILTVNGSEATGVLTITLSGEDDGSSITTGSGADVITGGTAVDVISAGAGIDTLNISGGLDRYTGGAGVDSYKFAASYDDSTDAITISDFTAGVGGDKIMFDVSEMDGTTAGIIDNLDMDAYVEGTVATIGTNTSSTAFANNSMLVITDSTFANIAAVEAELVVEAGADLTDFAVLFLNSTTGKAELYISDTTANATNDYLVATFSNITTLVGVAEFAAQNFTDF
jgi:S-layer protein